MMVLEQQGADDIDGKAEAGDADRLVEMDRLRLKYALYRFDQHEQGDAGQGDGAGESTEDADLAGAEGEAGLPAFFLA